MHEFPNRHLAHDDKTVDLEDNFKTPTFNRANNGENSIVYMHFLSTKGISASHVNRRGYVYNIRNKAKFSCIFVLF